MKFAIVLCGLVAFAPRIWAMVDFDPPIAVTFISKKEYEAIEQSDNAHATNMLCSVIVNPDLDDYDIMRFLNENDRNVLDANQQSSALYGPKLELWVHNPYMNHPFLYKTIGASLKPAHWALIKGRLEVAKRLINERGSTTTLEFGDNLNFSIPSTAPVDDKQLGELREYVMEEIRREAIIHMCKEYECADKHRIFDLYFMINKIVKAEESNISIFKKIPRLSGLSILDVVKKRKTPDNLAKVLAMTAMAKKLSLNLVKAEYRLITTFHNWQKAVKCLPEAGDSKEAKEAKATHEHDDVQE